MATKAACNADNSRTILRIENNTDTRLIVARNGETVGSVLAVSIANLEMITLPGSNKVEIEPFCNNSSFVTGDGKFQKKTFSLIEKAFPEQAPCTQSRVVSVHPEEKPLLGPYLLSAFEAAGATCPPS